MLEAREVNTAEEVHKAIENMNKRLRKFLDSETFGQKFSEEETHVLSQYLCAGWSVDIKIPVRSPEALPVILVDLPGSTEGGLIGEFIKTMVRGNCIRASTALLVLGWENIAELDRDGADPTQRFFGGASNFSGYYMVITKVFEKVTFDQINQTVCRKAAQLKPEPLGIRFINSYLLRAHAASLAGSLPENFPSVETDASDEERCRCEGEQHRCQIIFRGAENRLMQKKDQKKFNGKDLEEELKEKLDEFPETASFTTELYSSVDKRFPELFLGPHLERMQRQLVDESHQRVEICLGSEHQRQVDIGACRKLLSNLDDELLEPAKEKAKLMVQGRIKRMAEVDWRGLYLENTEEFYNALSEICGQEFAKNWCAGQPFFNEIRCSAERETTRAYKKILHQQLAEKVGWIRESDIPSDISQSLSLSSGEAPLVTENAHKQQTSLEKIVAVAAAAIPALIAAPAIPAAPVVLAASAVFRSAHSVSAASFMAKTPDTPDQRLADLQECRDLSLSRFDDFFKASLQTSLESRLRMLEEKESDFPHLDEKLQQYLTIFGSLQEIAKIVKDP